MVRVGRNAFLICNDKLVIFYEFEKSPNERNDSDILSILTYKLGEFCLKKEKIYSYGNVEVQIQENRSEDHHTLVFDDNEQSKLFLMKFKAALVEFYNQPIRIENL